jgi:predicted Zn-dependent protease
MVLRTIEPRTGRSLDQAARQHMRESGYKAIDLTPATIGGMEAVVGTYEGSASGIGNVTARGAHVVLDRNTFFIGGIAPPEVYARVSGDFDRAIQSFRQMSRDEAEAVEPNLIDLYTAREGDTWQSIAQRAGKGLVAASTLAIMNDHAIDEQPKPGVRLKIVVAGS